jgi:hypothetical protein
VLHHELANSSHSHVALACDTGSTPSTLIIMRVKTLTYESKLSNRPFPSPKMSLQPDDQRAVRKSSRAGEWYDGVMVVMRAGANSLSIIIVLQDVECTSMESRGLLVLKIDAIFEI